MADLRGRMGLNTYEDGNVALALKEGLGLEIDRYLTPIPPEEMETAREACVRLSAGQKRVTLHGTAISREIEEHAHLSVEETLDYLQQSVDLAMYAGIRRVVFHSCWNKAVQIDDWVLKFSGIWREMLNRTPDDFIIYLENVIDPDPEAMIRLCDSIGSMRFKLCLDIGHAHSNNEDCAVEEWVKRMGKRIGHAHLHDNDGTFDKHWVLGKGTINCADVIRALEKETGEKTTYTLECDSEESLMYLRANDLLK